MKTLCPAFNADALWVRHAIFRVRDEQQEHLNARKSGNDYLDDFFTKYRDRASAKHLLSKSSLTEVMQSSYVFLLFWLAHVFYILSTQGTDVLKHVEVHNETDEATLKLMFKKFVQTHNRTYVNDTEEYNRRLSVFKVVCLIILLAK